MKESLESLESLELKNKEINNSLIKLQKSKKYVEEHEKVFVKSFYTYKDIRNILQKIDVETTKTKIEEIYKKFNIVNNIISNNEEMINKIIKNHMNFKKRQEDYNYIKNQILTYLMKDDEIKKFHNEITTNLKNQLDELEYLKKEIDKKKSSLIKYDDKILEEDFVKDLQDIKKFMKEDFNSKSKIYNKEVRKYENSMKKYESKMKEKIEEIHQQKVNLIDNFEFTKDSFINDMIDSKFHPFNNKFFYFGSLITIINISILSYLLYTKMV
jgi:hypothetical protein